MHDPHSHMGHACLQKRVKSMTGNSPVLALLWVWLMLLLEEPMDQLGKLWFSAAVMTFVEAPCRHQWCWCGVTHWSSRSFSILMKMLKKKYEDIAFSHHLCSLSRFCCQEMQVLDLLSKECCGRLLLSILKTGLPRAPRQHRPLQTLVHFLAEVLLCAECRSARAEISCREMGFWGNQPG